MLLKGAPGYIIPNLQTIRNNQDPDKTSVDIIQIQGL